MGINDDKSFLVGQDVHVGQSFLPTGRAAIAVQIKYHRSEDSRPVAWWYVQKEGAFGAKGLDADIVVPWLLIALCGWRGRGVNRCGSWWLGHR